jgi:hypothetical protein
VSVDRTTVLERVRELGVDRKLSGDVTLGEALIALADLVLKDGREATVRTLLDVIRSL